LSGREVQEMFDFVARRSSGRGCNSQAQIAGARVVVTCGSCDRDGDGIDDKFVSDTPCETDTICGAGNICNTEQGRCEFPMTACAETINIGLKVVDQNVNCFVSGAPLPCCTTDQDCNPDPTIPPYRRSLCEPTSHVCMQPLEPDASYALAANDFIAAGGSGFFVLQRNTTQVNTFVQLRDSVVDFVQNGKPCGWDAAVEQAYRQAHPDAPPRGDDGLLPCAVDSDCSTGFYCSCPERIEYDAMTGICSTTANCTAESGRCVLRSCKEEMEALLAQDCPTHAPQGDPDAVERCLCSAADRAGETCKLLACFDASVGAEADGRLRMVSRR
jgi:5'-nucleotidase / UDP-sugar diphosphatase